MPALRDGDRLLVIDRKLFKDDNTRLFVGVIEEYDEVAVRVRGYPFHLSPYEIQGAERHGEERVRIISIPRAILSSCCRANWIAQRYH